MLMDEGLLIARGRWTTSTIDGHVPRPSRRCSRRGSTGSTARSGRVIERACGPGQGVLRGCGRGARSASPRGAGPLACSVRCFRKELIRPDRTSSRRARLPVPPSADPRRGLRLDPEGGAGRAARAIRPLARADGRRAGGRVRGDRRVPPRAGLPVPRRTRRGRRRNARDRPRGGRAAWRRRDDGHSSAVTRPPG